MTGFHVIAGSTETLVHPPVRRIGVSDLVDALHLGFSDFWEKPSHYVFLCLIYPLVGVVLATWTSGNNALPLLFPLMSGFALIGPFAALGLYEISRRREAGLDTSWWHALEVRQSPAIPSIIAVGLFLLAIFVVWLLAAQAVYMWCFGPNPPASLGSFVTRRAHHLARLDADHRRQPVGLIFAMVGAGDHGDRFPDPARPRHRRL